MVLIHSLSFDHSTSEVIDWLFFNDKPFLRINSDHSDSLNNIDFEIFNCYWFRKGEFFIGNRGNFKMPRIHYLLEENQIKISQYIEVKLSDKKYLNRYFNSNPNKLLVLEKAKKMGLKVPDFLLTNNLKDTSKKFIYKPINEGGYLELEDYIATAYTEIYDQGKKQDYGITFFQEMIDKKYELRIFYLDGRFFAMAIMSQKDKQTAIDFRHYNERNPNRNIPFQLPQDIENKLDSLMKMLDLKSGSIDMIVSKDRQYYFLEINPVGQFGMVSYPCNYHLEKEIAEYLNYD